MIAKEYRRRQPVVEAIQYDGTNLEEIEKWPSGAVNSNLRGIDNGLAFTVGNFIVKFPDNVLVAYPAEMFHKMFHEVDL